MLQSLRLTFFDHQLRRLNDNRPINSELESFDYTTTEGDYDETNLPNVREEAPTDTIITITWWAEQNATRREFDEGPTNNKA